MWLLGITTSVDNVIDVDVVATGTERLDVIFGDDYKLSVCVAFHDLLRRQQECCLIETTMILVVDVWSQQCAALSVCEQTRDSCHIRSLYYPTVDKQHRISTTILL